MTTLQNCLIAVVIILAFSVSGYFVGVGHTEARLQAKINEQDKALVKLQQNQQQTADRIVTKYVDRVQTITKEVNVYVPSPSDCQSLPYSFVQFINSAAGVQVPETTRTVDGSTVPLATIANTTASNLRSCRVQAERLSALQDWAKSVSQ